MVLFSVFRVYTVVYNILISYYLHCTKRSKFSLSVGEHMEPPKEFIPYEHMRIRRKVSCLLVNLNFSDLHKRLMV